MNELAVTECLFDGLLNIRVSSGLLTDELVNKSID